MTFLAACIGEIVADPATVVFPPRRKIEVTYAVVAGPPVHHERTDIPPASPSEVCFRGSEANCIVHFLIGPCERVEDAEPRGGWVQCVYLITAGGDLLPCGGIRSVQCPIGM